MSDDMKQDTVLTLNWLRINLPTILAIFGVVLFLNSWMTEVNKTLESMREAHERRLAETDKNFAAINSKLQVLETIPYKTAQNEAYIRSVEVRFEKYMESQSQKLDLVLDQLSAMKIQLGVLSSKLESANRAIWRDVMNCPPEKPVVVAAHCRVN